MADTARKLFGLQGLFGVIFALAVLTGSSCNAHDNAFDLSKWAEVFARSASISDVDKMVEIVKAAGLDSESLKPLVKGFNSVVGDEPCIYTELIDDETVGTVYHRITLAVIFKNRSLFYKITFMRKEEWKLIGLAMNYDYEKTRQIGW